MNIIVLITTILTVEITTILYRGIVSNRYMNFLMSFSDDKLRMFESDFSTLIIDEKLQVHKRKYNIFARYYISGFGSVPRWSKLDNKIENYYITALSKEYDKIYNIKHENF